LGDLKMPAYRKPPRLLPSALTLGGFWAAFCSPQLVGFDPKRVRWYDDLDFGQSLLRYDGQETKRTHCIMFLSEFLFSCAR
jgi:hypothetical protein